MKDLIYQKDGITDLTDNEFLLRGHWPYVMVFRTGTKEKPVTLINGQDFSGGDDSTAYHTIRSHAKLADAEYVKIRGFSPTAPFIINGGLNSAINIISKNLEIDNVIATDYGFAGVHLNDRSRNQVIIKNFRMFGASKDGEFIYVGNTNPAITPDITDNFYMGDSLAYDKGRDGFQIVYGKNFIVENSTFFDLGKINMLQQNHCIQIKDSSGIIRNCIFDSIPALCNIRTHGVLITNNYFSWSLNQPGWIGKLLDEFKNPICRKGEPIIIEGNIFNPLIDNDFLFQIAESGCEIIIRKNIIHSKVRNIVKKLNTDVKVTVQDNIFVDNIESPIYSNFNPLDVLHHGQCSNYLYMGYEQKRNLPPDYMKNVFFEDGKEFMRNKVRLAIS